MPRIFTSANDPLDFCLDCFPTEDEAIEAYAGLRDGPDNRGNCFTYNAEHPLYEHETYLCEECGRPLIEEDNELL